MHEAAPYAGAGHLEGFFDLPAKARDAYAGLPGSTWATAPGGRDAIYHTLGMHTLPTSKAQGYYQGPRGPEFNPAEAARPLVDFDPGPHGHTIPVTTQDMLNAAGGIRALTGVQGGVGWMKPFLSDKGRSQADAIMAQADRPITREQLAAANEAATKHGMMAIDLGDGRTVAFDPNFSKSPKDISAAMKGGLGKDLGPDARHLRKEGGYFSLEDELKSANAGQGRAVDKTLEVIDKLHPDVRERLSDSPYIADVVRAMAARDAAFGAKHGLPLREDVGNMREAMSSPGWLERLRQMRADNVPLPGIAVGGLGLSELLSRYEPRE
jgi:hypothetical protein